MTTTMAAAADAPDSSSGGPKRHFVYVESNDTRPGRNSILAYGIGEDGSLSPLRGSPFPTGGTGFFDPNFKLGPFDNDQEIVLSPSGRTLYAVNGGSNSISAMHIERDGSLAGLLGWPVASDGSTPVSIGRHGDSLIVVNGAEDPAQAAATPNLSVIDLLPGGYPLRRPLASLDLPAGSDPTQALTTSTGRFTFTTGFPGGGTIGAYTQGWRGAIVKLDEVTPPQVGGAAALPLGLWANPNAPYLYVGFVNVNTLGVYRWNSRGQLSFVRSVPNSGKALCWIRTTRDGRFLLTSNTADGSMSVYDLSDPARPVEIQHVAVGGAGGLEQFSFDPDERHVYVLEQENSAASVGKSNRVHVLDFNGRSGALTNMPDLTVTLPVPATNRAIGLAVR